MRTPYVMGNWKMNGSKTSSSALLEQLVGHLSSASQAVCVVFPPAAYLPLVQSNLTGSAIAWGGQNVYPASNGAFTGENSCPMLLEFGCQYVLVGHSERRHFFCEDVKFVAEKFHHVKEHGMIPVLCIGETLEERNVGRTCDVLTQQLQAIIKAPETDFENCVIAYEPVWAIGTGCTPTAEEVQEVHAFVREWVARQNKVSADKVSILYGGSLNAKNSRALFNMPDVDGGLVGGASLHAEPFLEIVKCINS